MSFTHLFPCPACSQDNELVLKQAGQELTCQHCSETFAAPRLGSLKRLPIAESSQSPAEMAKQRRRDPRQRNSLASIGLFVLLLGLVVGAGTLYYANQIWTEIDIEAPIAEYNDLSDKMNPAEVYLDFSSLRVENGLPEWKEPEYVGDNIQSQILSYFAYGTLGVGAIGFLVFLSAFLMKK